MITKTCLGRKTAWPNDDVPLGVTFARLDTIKGMGFNRLFLSKPFSSACCRAIVAIGMMLLCDGLHFDTAVEAKQAPPKQKLTCFIPVRDNHGVAYSSELLESIEAAFLKVADGYTLRGLTEGAYRSPTGMLYKDTCREYFILFQRAEQLRQLQQQLAGFAKTMEQEVLYCEVSKPQILWIQPH